jgi:hypothetical protein
MAIDREGSAGTQVDTGESSPGGSPTSGPLLQYRSRDLLGQA